MIQVTIDELVSSKGPTITIALQTNGIHSMNNYESLMTSITYLTDHHVVGLLQIRPQRVDHVDVVHLVALNGVRLDQLNAIVQQLLRNVVDRLVLSQLQVDMRR